MGSPAASIVPTRELYPATFIFGAKRLSTPVNDFYNTDVKIREDGRVMHMMHLWQVKQVAESKYPYDYCKEVVTIPPDQAWRPLAEGGCPLVKA